MTRRRKLNIGCGRDVRPDHVDLDRVLLPEIDLVATLEAPLPFADEVFQEVVAVHVLEHVGDFLGLVTEVHRVLEPGGLLRVFVPHFSSVGAHTDPTHKRFFGHGSFDYFTVTGSFNFYSHARFEIRRRELRFFWIKNERREIRSRLVSWLINVWPRCYERFFCWILPCTEIAFQLEVVKREPTGAR